MFLAAITPVLVFIAFLLLLLVSLSAPIIKSIYLFRLTANISSSLFRSGVSESAQFGVWGYCLSGLQANVISISKTTAAQCSKTHLGYTFDSTVANALNAQELQSIISRTTTGALVLHPIVAALAFVTLLTSLFILRRGSNGTSRLPSLITTGIGALTAFLTTVVFLIDVIFVAVVRHRVSDATDGKITLVWGNAVWMVLGAAIALWLSTLGACTGVFACGKNRYVSRALSFHCVLDFPPRLLLFLSSRKSSTY
ncbi:pali-domain-containing protein [Pholiota conissans]|uniref:Pali-domain-containing protein n=1 Tax=Pholiota conissans TaxID=109636 RepID=A0A9P5ZAF5_9AGAR|nr:pali-domain-containing protein [Pholiota conissans]